MFDPNAASTADSGIFGLPHSEQDSAIVFLPVPWEATTSYGGGTSDGPMAIFLASKQVDLYDLDVHKPYEAGMYMRPESAEVRYWNDQAKMHADRVIDAAGQIAGNTELEAAAHAVNQLGWKLNQFVLQNTKEILKAGKIPAIVGGDHSVPYGAIQAVAEKHSGFGILHFDAHSDTRKAFEGFTWSHASIMHNVLENIPQVAKLVQVGIRDVCEQEIDYVLTHKDRVRVFYDKDIARRKFESVSWAVQCREIVASLPNEVWISFDIDGLDPRFCPHTGTPVPGGLDFHEAAYLIGAVVRSGRRIIGFDLNEVAPESTGENEWDANVGARLLYKLAAWTLASQSKAKLL